MGVREPMAEPANDEPAIRVRGLSVGFGGVPLLRDLDFDVERGDVFVILGGSGCGKTTLMRNIIGLEEPMAGTVEITGAERIGGLTEKAPAFGVAFQAGALFGSMTLEENVALPLQKWTGMPEAAISAVARARLRLVGLGGFENHLPAEVSGGMKKRAAIARALALDSSLLFLDEPSAGLDPVTAAELDDLILTLSRDLEVTIVLVTHELPSIFKVASNCIMLDKKSKGIIACGDPRRLRDEAEDPRVLAFFNRQAQAS